MKKFQFRLQRVLWYHEQRQKQAEVRLQQAAIQREAAYTDLLNVQQQLERACHLPEQAGRLVDLPARLNVAEHLQTLGRTVTAAGEKLKLADERLREADRVRREITKDVEALLHLRIRQQADYEDDVARQQQIVLDEVVMRQWSMRDADATASGTQTPRHHLEGPPR
jgi:flagellar biosynthesis chaperone FliJ